MKRRFFALATILFSAALLGCTQAGDIQLKGGPVERPVSENKPAATPTPAPQAPSDPAGDSPTGNQPTTEDPSMPPVPAAARYRMLCDDRYPPFITAVSSLAGPLSFGASIDVGPANTPSGEFDPHVPNTIGSHEAPVYVSRPGLDLVRSIFVAEERGDASTGWARKKYVYSSDMDLVRRQGVAIKLAAHVSVSFETTQLSDKTGVTARSFGASDAGHYFLIGTKQGYELRDAETRAILGTLKVGSAGRFVNPELRESDRLFSVSEVVNGSWTTHFYTVGFSAQGSVSDLKSVDSVSGLARPLRRLYRVQGVRTAFSGDLFYSLTHDRKELLLWDRSQRQTESFELLGIPTTGGRLAVSVALSELPSGELKLMTVYENFELVPDAMGAKYKIRDSILRPFILDRRTATAKWPGAGDVPYPSDAKRALEVGTIFDVNPGIRDLQVTPDGEAVFGLFTSGGLSKRLYRVESGITIPVSQVACQNMSIGVE